MSLTAHIRMYMYVHAHIYRYVRSLHNYIIDNTHKIWISNVRINRLTILVMPPQA